MVHVKFGDAQQIIRVISFSRKINLLGFDYKLCDCSVTRIDCIKGVGVHIDSKLIFTIMWITYFLRQLGCCG